MSDLLDNSALERSEVVANSLMNRERGITGANSYAKDLHFNPLEFLRARLRKSHDVAWLDLCCGTSKALIEAAGDFVRAGYADRATIIGVDLIPGFLVYPPESPCLRFEAASLSSWKPDIELDLITCVHGLHYIGDKLGVLQMAVSALKVDGYMIAHLDLNNLHLDSAEGSRKTIKQWLVESGFRYDPRRRILSRVGRAELTPFWTYLGADDTAGPNSTGQPAVTSHYGLISPP